MNEEKMDHYSPTYKKRMEILLVEDSQADIDITREAFQEERILSHLTVIKDGAEVMPFLKREGKYKESPRPDLIILDLTLPNKDGREILQDIKSDWGLKIIPVIVMTSSDSDIDLFRSYSMGANSYIRKPLDFHQFSKGIKAIGEFWFTLVKLPEAGQLSDFLDVSTTSFRAPGTKATRERKDDTTVLVVEDNEADVELVKEYLSGEGRFNILTADTLAKTFEVMAKEKVDVILLDLTLPDSKGHETFIKFHLHFKDYPIVIYTMTDDLEFALGAVRAGAQDYIVKGEINSKLLARVLKYAIQRNEVEKDMEKLLHLSQAANESSQRAVLARDEFISIVSHELKSPVSSIKLKTQMLDQRWEKLDESKRRKYIHEMNIQVNRLTHTINRIMDISRINAGHLKIEPEDVNLSDLVYEVISKLEDKIQSEGYEIILQLEEDIIGNWDSTRIEQVLTNLLTNAFRYGEGKPVTIGSKKTNGLISISVTDQGPGIPGDKLSTIFERFQRATTKESKTGLGLGLYITQKIVESHGGQILVDSQIGKGTRFTVELPERVSVRGERPILH